MRLGGRVVTMVYGLGDETDMRGLAEEGHLDPATAVEDVNRSTTPARDPKDRDGLEVEILHHQPLKKPTPLQATDLEVQGLPASASVVTTTSHLELSRLSFSTMNYLY